MSRQRKLYSLEFLKECIVCSYRGYMECLLVFLNFFEQCPHRMACAKCDFYMPKDSMAALLLEGKEHLLRLLQEIPLR
jgi:hypothetical protein